MQKSEANAGKAESSGTKKPSSGALYTAIVNTSVLTSNTPSESCYIDSGVSTHLILTKSDLRSYREFERPLAIAADNSGILYAYGSGTAHVTTSTGDIEREADLEDVYYAPEVHVRLLSQLGLRNGREMVGRPYLRSRMCVEPLEFFICVE